jgi:hypothetical protein
VQAGLSRLDQIAVDWEVQGPALAALRAHLDQQARRYRQWLDRLEAGEDAYPSSSPGHLPDASLGILERELDHEERILLPHDDH